MNRKIISSLLVAVFLLLTIVSPLLAVTRQYIGDEPPDNYIVGRQGNIADAITTQISVLPSALPDNQELRDRLIWLRYPANNYHFRTAAAVDQNYFTNKMQDASAAMQDAMANMMFGVTRGAALLANNLVLILFDNYIGESMFRAIGKVVNTITAFEQGSLMSLIFILALCMLGIGIAIFLIKAQLMRAVTSFLVAAFFVACIIAYAANVDRIIPTTMNFINNTTGIALMATSYMKDINIKEGEVEVNSIAGETKLLDQGLVEVTNSMWHIMVGAPWAVGMFGNADPDKLKLLPDEVNAINKDIEKVVSFQFLGPDGVFDLQINWDNLLPWGAKTKIPDDAYMDSVWLACSNDVKDSMLQAITGTKARHESDNTAVIFTAGQGMVSSTHHMMVAMFSLIPAIIFLIFVLVVGVPVLIAQFVLMFLLILLPFALLLGVAGEKGTQVAIVYIKNLLGAAATKIIYGFYMSFILLFTVSLSKLPAAQDSYALGGFLISIILVFGIMFRKKFYQGIMGVVAVNPGRDFGDDTEDWLRKAGGYVTTAAVAWFGGHVADKNDGNKIIYMNNNPTPPEGSRSGSEGGNIRAPRRNDSEYQDTPRPIERDMNESPGIIGDTGPGTFWAEMNPENNIQEQNPGPTDHGSESEYPRSLSINESPSMGGIDTSSHPIDFSGPADAGNTHIPTHDEANPVPNQVGASGAIPDRQSSKEGLADNPSPQNNVSQIHNNPPLSSPLPQQSYISQQPIEPQEPEDGFWDSRNPDPPNR